MDPSHAYANYFPSLSPYYRNFGKRLIKSPKIYFVEPGLACWLLGIESPKEAARDPLHGNLFENMVVVEAFKARLNQGKEPQMYFWQDLNTLRAHSPWLAARNIQWIIHGQL